MNQTHNLGPDHERFSRPPPPLPRPIPLDRPPKVTYKVTYTTQPLKDHAMTLADIFDTYTPGSLGFCTAVETHCGFEVSRPEIERIALRAAVAGPDSVDLAAEFRRVWSEDAWWRDNLT